MTPSARISATPPRTPPQSLAQGLAQGVAQGAAEPSGRSPDEPADALPRPAGRGEAIRRTARMVLPYIWPANDPRSRWRVVATLGLLVAGRGVTVAVPFVYAAVVTRLAHGAAAIPVALIMGYGLLQGVGRGMDGLRDLVFAPLALRLSRTLTRDAARHVHGLSLRYHLERQTGALTRSIERGSDAIGQMTRIILFNIMPTLLDTLLTIIVVGRLFGARYVAVMLGALGTYCLVTLRVTHTRIVLRRERNEASGVAQHRLVDSLLNHETVRYFGAEAFEDARIDAAQADLEAASRRLQNSASRLGAIQNLIIATACVAIMVMAAHDMDAGRIGIGRFVLVNTYLLGLYRALTSIGYVYAALRAARVDLEQMLALLAERPDVMDAPDADDLPRRLDAPDAPAVAFEAAGFAYDPRRPILSGVTFLATPGQRVALVGETGAGKSTVGRLLFRSYDVQHGRILIDGRDIRGVTQASLRASIGVVPQDAVLFNDTIGFNIAYGRPDAGQDAIESAARQARLHDFITNLPEGYDTVVGERGLKLSGGEKQRIAIARVILKDPRILMLDEATSALDTHTEVAIQEALRDLTRRRTTIAIAHRLSSIRHFDQILVMERGRIVERGTHASLMAHGGRYAAMWTAQDREVAPDGADYP